VEHTLDQFSTVLQSLSPLEHIRVTNDCTFPPPAFYDQVHERRCTPVRQQAVAQEAIATTTESSILTSGKSIQDFNVDGVRWQLVGNVKGRPMIPDEALHYILCWTSSILSAESHDQQQVWR
jgi:hypothetical protein